MADVEVLELLQKIDARLDKLEQKQNEALNAMSIFADSVDEIFDPSEPGGTCHLQKLERIKELVQLLSDDKTLHSIKEITAVLPHLKDGVSLATDTLDEVMAYAMENNLDVEKFLKNLKEISILLLDHFESGAMTKLLDSGILDHRSIVTVGMVGKSMAISGHQTKPASISKVFGAFFDPNVRSAIGFAINFASQFGKKIRGEKNV